MAPKENPYTPKYHGPYNKAVDAVGDDLEPKPFRNREGADILGPRNISRGQQQPDMSFADSHMCIEEGGWARQTTVRELPTSKELAGVNMRLDEGAIRELHWHKEASCRPSS